ncbi:DUF4041 domain-containing protein [Staphylococcus kloosii]|uniref:Bacteriophage T5 Orf172 DNA-binding domain-containing protein n=5 Tax=Staphylococcus kloosii TaxID=29384 RepID=A0ABQ0XMQ9_9STAP|nr:DUF4041 domain-containing protein [Staphylococcus kloosii]AVQ34847.1 DUF4041 domain-containing protein [Staphylococcus kloosii]GEP82707.1 hypothetical protein SKL01_18850 [Staphylococcus kloosii]SUM50410.1 exported protein [Staphylococcus kloosii]
MSYYKNDFNVLTTKLGENIEILFSSKGTFNCDSKDRNGSYFFSKTHLYFIRGKDNFAYRIPFNDILSIERHKKTLSDYLLITYGKNKTAKIVIYNSESLEIINYLINLVNSVENQKSEITEEKNNIKLLHKQTKEELASYKNATLNKIEERANTLKINVKNKESTICDLNQTINDKKIELQELSNKLYDTKLENDFNDIFVRHFEENITSSEINDKISLLNLKEKQFIKDNLSVLHYGYEDKKTIINSQIKQILRSFDTECNYFYSNLTFKNYQSYHNKLVKSFETLNRIYKVDNVKITTEYLQLKLEKLNLIYEKAKKIEEEREIQKEIKEQMKEEERVRRELENERKKLEKEERQFNNEVNSLFKRLEKANNDIEKELYAEKIKQLEDKINELQEDKKDVINRETNTRAGYVYVISNIGSFGEDIFKIGMTRRLEPYDRIKELGDASVPFSFDVHAMIFSDDAPKLENILHKHFRDREINKVNHRKEFFRVSIDEIESVVKTNHNNTVEFIKIPQAEQYWESQNLSNNETLIDSL